MAHLIDKDALLAEIERRIKAIPIGETDKCLKAVYGNEAFVLHDLLSFIGTLEVKDVYIENLQEETELADDGDFPKEEPVNNNFEEAANNAVIALVPSFGQKYSDGSYVSCYRGSFERQELLNLFKAGANWQKEQILGCNTTLQRTFELGKQEMKQQLIAKAVGRLKHYLDNSVWVANDVGVREKEVIIEDFENYLKGE